MAVIALPQVLREKFGEAAAQAFLEVLNQVEKQTRDSSIESVEDRFERRLAEMEARMIRWMFIFWIGQFASIVGVLSAILFAFFKH